MAHSVPSRKRRKTSPVGSKADAAEVTNPFNILDTEFSKNAVAWDLEQTYEKRSRVRDLDAKKQKLPLKTAQGVVEQYEESAEDQPDTSPGLSGSESPITEPSDNAASSTEAKGTAYQQILEAKEELARIASLVNENPEDHISSLKTLTLITSSKNHTITRLGLVTQLAVYKDIIPGYRIRPISEHESNVKVSKEVRKQRTFEQTIVRGYQTYVRELKHISSAGNNSTEQQKALVDVAVGCACNLLQSVPHFNFRNELLSIIINKIRGRRRDSNFARCAVTIANIFESDEDGSVSLEAVSMLSKVIKNRDYRIHEDVLNLFLHLRLLSEFSHKGSDTGVNNEKENGQIQGKRSKKQREHWSKKARKLVKERKAIEKEMKAADAIFSYEQRDKNQAETLKLVLSIYFRVLKARPPGLMGAVLEGLVKYAHLINQDFFGDLLEALRELVNALVTPEHDDDALDSGDEERLTDERHQQSTTRESLLCVITALGLLQGQDVAKSASGLGLDLSFFITHLYQTLHSLALHPNVELSSSTTRVHDPDTTRSEDMHSLKVNVSTTIVLLLRSLRAVLLPQNARSVPPVRVAAFSKQLMTCALQIPEKSATAMLGLINDVVKTHRGKINSLWHSDERRGDGVFNPLYANLEGSNPFASTVWEGELLQLHYCPQVRDGAVNLYSILNDT